MRLRRRAPHADGDRSSGQVAAEADPSEPGWDILAELDRLRSANSGLTAEVERQTQVGHDYARAASEERLRVEELERENAIAHANCQMLERRLAQTEERAKELEELVEALRAQRDRLQTYFEQQRDRADRAEAACAAMRDASSELLSASQRQAHAALGTRGLARAKVDFADALSRLQRALASEAGKDFLAPSAVEDVRRFFTEASPPEEKQRLEAAIIRAVAEPGATDENR
jgi:chromosome segregation ATPase